MSFPVKLLLLFLFCARVAISNPIYITFPSDVDWKVKRSKHFSAIFPKGHDSLAVRALRSAERAHRILAPIFPEGPDHTWLVLGDWQDATNGYALDLPYPHIVVYAAPPSANGQLSSLGNWFDSMILHEYVHIRHLYPASGLWKPMRFLFGNWVLPNALLPLHFHEGMAVLMETEFAQGGRGSSAYFNMFRRMAVVEGKWGTSDFISRDRMDGTVGIWPHGSSPYFFGSLMHEEMWRLKGKKGITELTDSYSSNWPGFYNGPLNEVYGKDHSEIWERVFDHGEKVARKEIQAIRKEGLVPLRYLTQSRYNKWDLTVSPSKRYVAFRSSHPEERGMIKVFDLRSKKFIRKIESRHGGSEGFCWGKVGKRGYWIIVRPAFDGQRSHFSLHLYDIRADSFSRIQIDSKNSKHIHQLSCASNLSGAITYEETGGRGFVRESKVAVAKRNAKTTRRWRIPTGTWVTSLLYGPSHWISLRRGLNTELYRWSANAKAPVRVATVKGHVFYLRWVNGELFALADFDGRWEVWSFSQKSKKFKKRVPLMGGANSFGVLGKKLLLASYRHGGFDVAVADTKNGVNRAPRAIPEPVDREPAEVSKTEDYSAWSTILPRMWVPNFLIVPDGFQIGAWIPGFDISQRHQYQIFGGYDSRGKPFGDFGYTYRFAGTWGLSLGTYFLPSYIQSTKNFFEVWGGSIRLTGQLSPLSLGWSLGPVYRRVEASVLGDAQQNVGVEVGINKRMGFKSRPDGIAPIRGTSVALTHTHYFEELGSNDTHFRSVLTLRQYWESFWARNHVFLFALQAGYGQGSVFFNSFFEGGGELLFYQRRGSFLARGFVPGRFLGREMAALSVEYLFPLFTIERGWGLTPAFLKRIHLGIICDVLTRGRGVNHPDDVFQSGRNAFLKDFFWSAGLEIKTDWKFFHYLPGQFRIGLYRAFDPTGEEFYFNFGLLAGL